MNGSSEIEEINANANGIICQMADEIERLTCALSGLIQECEYSASSGLPFNALGGEWTQLAKSKAILAGREVYSHPTEPWRVT